MTYVSSSAGADVSLTRLGLRIIRLCSRRACAARQLRAWALRKRARRRLHGAAAVNAIVRRALGRDDRRDSDVAFAKARLKRARRQEHSICVVDHWRANVRPISTLG